MGLLKPNNGRAYDYKKQDENGTLHNVYRIVHYDKAKRKVYIQTYADSVFKGLEVDSID